MANVQQFLRNNGLTALQSKYQIRVRRHIDLPLIILNYTNQISSTPIEEECRGLVIEDKTFKVVAKPFTRFFKMGIKKQLKDINLLKSVVQSKEDGTLMILYNYNGLWKVNCIQNFANDTLPFNDEMTYLKLFEQILGLQLKNLHGIDKQCKKCTFLFEMCSVFNRVVTKYDNPQLFLLAINKLGDNETYIELDVNIVDDWAQFLGVGRPKTYHFKSHKDMVNCLVQKEKNDITFEGFVIVGPDKQRYKLKNHSYLMLHRLRFRNWIAATRKTLGGFIRNNQLDQLRQCVVEFGSNVAEIEYAIQTVIRGDKIDHRYHTNKAKKYCNFRKYYDNMDKLVAKENDGLATIMPAKTDDGNWIVTCTCDTRMNLVRLKRDHVVPSMCHCKKRVGVYSIRTGRLIYTCPNCDNTHECHQQNTIFDNEGILYTEGEPLGIPCSVVGKIFRLWLHSIFDKLWRTKIMTKNDAYAHLSKMMNIERKDAHIAKFGISDCVKAVELIEKYMDQQNKNN